MSRQFREPSDYVSGCYEEIQRFRRFHREGPHEVIVSPRTYVQLQRALYADLRLELRGRVDESTEGLRVMGARVVADPHALDDRFYAINSRDYSDSRYDSIRMDYIASTPRFVELRDRVIALQNTIGEPQMVVAPNPEYPSPEPGVRNITFSGEPPAPVIPNRLSTLTAMFRDYLPHHLLSEELSRRDTLLDRVAREGAAFGPRVESRPASFFKEEYLPWGKPAQRFKRSKESKNWERRMITSMVNLAKEFA